MFYGLLNISQVLRLFLCVFLFFFIFSLYIILKLDVISMKLFRLGKIG